ncbi:MAG: alanine racemase [Cyanobacteria bacterium J083]|nr:MAG: alanine racemase [Cyanobacteria bacterium J083]
MKSLNIPCPQEARLKQRAWVEIDLGALAHNIKQLKNILSENTQLMAVVKADAYGHGAVNVAKVALDSGASWLAIATIEEGIELRKAGITAPILILGATNSAAEVKAIWEWQLQPTICSLVQAEVFAQTLASLGGELPVHIKLDTGMSRLGFPWQTAVTVVEKIQRLPGLKIFSVYSHLATADQLDNTILQLQQQRFQQAISSLAKAKISIPLQHLANCAAVLTSREFDYDLVRTGLAMYGLSPAPHLADKVDLKPVLSVKARITQIKTIPAGQGVSYGYQFIAQQATAIAIVGIGYADGVPRNLSNNLEVIIRGQKVEQIGAITMDQLILNVAKLPELQVGEIVTLLGKDGDIQITADEWANKLNTISWEILCGFKHRLPRITLSQS